MLFLCFFENVQSSDSGSRGSNGLHEVLGWDTLAVFSPFPIPTYDVQGIRKKAAGVENMCFFPHLPGEGCYILSELFSSSASASSSSQSRSQWALPDLNRELQIAVGTAGPPPRAQDPSGHCRTSTASSRSQWALPDLNRELQIAVGTAGPRLPDRSGHCRTSTATSRSQWALPDLNGKNVRKDVR